MNISNCIYPVVTVLVAIVLLIFIWFAVKHFTYDAKKTEDAAQSVYDIVEKAHKEENDKIAGLKATMDSTKTAHDDETDATAKATKRLAAKTAEKAHNDQVIKTNKLLKPKLLAESTLNYAKAHNIPAPPKLIYPD